MTPLDYARQHRSRFDEDLFALLRIPSVSTDPAHAEDVRRCAVDVAEHLRSIGMDVAELLETGGHPVVYAEHRAGQEDAPTVLVYGHYDVQPPDPLDLWNTPPFEPTVRDGKVYARGAADDKGQFMMHVKAVEAYLQTGTPLPVHLKMLIEGEEESGSTHLAPFLEKNRDKLAADVVVVSDTALFAPGVPSITSGLRGLAYVQVTLEGPDRDLHSGVFGGAVENPANALARMIAGLHDAQHRVTIEGFYDNVRPLSDEERQTYRSLPFDEKTWRDEIGVTASKTEQGYSILEATSARPTLDVNGMGSGYQGKGAKTVLPARAFAKISCRLVPDQDPHEITEKLRRHFEKHVPETMKLTFEDLHGGQAYLADTTTPAMQAAREALEQVFGTRAYFTREGGSIPITADFKKILGLDTVLMGFGLSTDALHSPNEHFGLDRYHQGIEAAIRFLDIYARQHVSA